VAALCYLNGWAVKADAARAMQLAQVSSAAGSKYGHFALGSYYYSDRFANKDSARAAALFQLSAAQDLAVAQWFLGRLYDAGDGVSQDKNEAKRLFVLAAKQWLPDAIRSVVACAADVDEEIYWLETAICSGFRFFKGDLQRAKKRKRNATERSASDSSNSSNSDQNYADDSE
jgi:TPR repeat protein